MLWNMTLFLNSDSSNWAPAEMQGPFFRGFEKYPGDLRLFFLPPKMRRTSLSALSLPETKGDPSG